jgi:DNA-binding NarL/FixJ family response regulator
MNGARATEAIKRARPQTKVVMLTSLAEEQALVESIAAGASGFVDKSRAIYDVVIAVRAAHRGEALVPSTALPRLLAELAAVKRAAQQRSVGGLTPREYEVLEALARGDSLQAIAERLVISPQTVATHVRNILGKLGVHSKLEAVTYAIRTGLIDPPR